MIFLPPGGREEDLVTQVSDEGPIRMRISYKKQRALSPLLFIWFTLLLNRIAERIFIMRRRFPRKILDFSE